MTPEQESELRAGLYLAVTAALRPYPAVPVEVAQRLAWEVMQAGLAWHAQRQGVEVTAERVEIADERPPDDP